VRGRSQPNLRPGSDGCRHHLERDSGRWRHPLRGRYIRLEGDTDIRRRRERRRAEREPDVDRRAREGDLDEAVQRPDAAAGSRWRSRHRGRSDRQRQLRLRPDRAVRVRRDGGDVDGLHARAGRAYPRQCHGGLRLLGGNVHGRLGRKPRAHGVLQREQPCDYRPPPGVRLRRDDGRDEHGWVDDVHDLDEQHPDQRDDGGGDDAAHSRLVRRGDAQQAGQRVLRRDAEHVSAELPGRYGLRRSRPLHRRQQPEPGRVHLADPPQLHVLRRYDGRDAAGQQHPCSRRRRAPQGSAFQRRRDSPEARQRGRRSDGYGDGPWAGQDDDLQVRPRHDVRRLRHQLPRASTRSSPRAPWASQRSSATRKKPTPGPPCA